MCTFSVFEKCSKRVNSKLKIYHQMHKPQHRIKRLLETMCLQAHHNILQNNVDLAMTSQLNINLELQARK